MGMTMMCTLTDVTMVCVLTDMTMVCVLTDTTMVCVLMGMTMMWVYLRVKVDGGSSSILRHLVTVVQVVAHQLPTHTTMHAKEIITIPRTRQCTQKK